MSTRTLAILVTIVLAGCGQIPTKPVATPTECDEKICKITVSAMINGESCTPSAADLYLKRKGKAARIVWRSDDPSLRFCASTGDGAFPKDVGQDQFSNGAATDHDDGSDDDNPARCKKYYRLDDANSDSTQGVYYQYSLRLHKSTSGAPAVPCNYDPQIRNG